MTHTHSWRICGSPIDPNLIGRQLGKHSITFARQTWAKSGLGEPSEPPCPQKAGSRTEPSIPCSIGIDQPPKNLSPNRCRANYRMSLVGQSRHSDRAPPTSGLARLADTLGVVPIRDSCAAAIQHRMVHAARR
jgi:hypothetical protein